MEFHQIGNSTGGKFELYYPILPENLADFDAVPSSILDWQGLEPEEVERLVQIKLDSIETQSVQKFRDFFSTFKPVSVLEYDGAWQLRFSNSVEINDFSPGTNFFLPSSDHDVLAALKTFTESYDIHSLELVEFLTYFHGLSSSSFWHGFTTSLSPVSFFNIDIEDSWEESVILFSEGTGDLLLMNEEQEVGWWYHESNQIGHFADSFAECLERFTEFKIKYLDHFGSHTAYNPKSTR